jgi:hypothetical protein
MSKRFWKIAGQLLLAFVGSVSVALLWGPLRLQCPWLPPWNAEGVLAILAISFAIIQFTDARRQETTLDRQKDHLSSIALSMSTRFIGPFPSNLKGIVELTSKADRNLKVIVDFPGYGQYSAPELRLAYKQQLELARSVRKVQTQIICYKSSLADKERLEQFPDSPTAFQGRDMTLWTNFLESHAGAPTKPTDFASLRKLLIEHDQNTVRGLKDMGVQWRFHPEAAAFFLWLRDDAEAIFTFKNVGKKDVGLSFLTSDANLIRQFVDIFDRRWEKAELNS